LVGRGSTGLGSGCCADATDDSASAAAAAAIMIGARKQAAGIDVTGSDKMAALHTPARHRATTVLDQLVFGRAVGRRYHRRK
jgi:hypothetical protein